MRTVSVRMTRTSRPAVPAAPRRRAARSLVAGAFLWLVLLASPWAVRAAEKAHEQGWGWIDTIGRWTNLLILFGVIIYFVRTPFRRFLSGRSAAIKDDIQASTQAYEQARAEKASLEARIEHIDEELAAIRLEAEKEAEAERARTRDQAERDAQRLLDTSRREIDNMTRAAQKNLREYAARLSIELAENQIRGEMKPQDERRVVDRFFVTLGEKKEG